MSTLTAAPIPAQDAATLALFPRRARFLALLLLPAIALTIWLVISQQRTTRPNGFVEAAIPDTIILPDRVWTSLTMHLSDREMDILETHDYVYRTYSDGVGAPVDLCLVFSEDNRKGTHPPDVCLEGGGSRILARYDRTLALAPNQTLPLRELVTSYGNHLNYFCYFYKCGDTFTASFYEQQAKIIWFGMTGRDASGALARYSTPLNDMKDLEQARARTDQLILATFPSIREKLNAH